MKTEEIIKTQNKNHIIFLLSEFYLDTELDENSMKRIIFLLKKENFQLSEILEINKKEVYPVLAYNLISVAGIWQGFEEEDLIKEVNKYSQKTRWGKFIHNLPLFFHFGLKKEIEKEIRINFNRYQ
jgi:hypothetical protein